MLTISVVVTCYNLQEYIGQAVTSALNQKYEGPVEIIVVDDCSTDSSRDIISSFKGVRGLSTPSNSGVLLATIHGIEHAAGDVIFFLDGDDVWHEDKLAECMVPFNADPELAMVTHDVRFIGRLGAHIGRKSRSSEEWSKRGAASAHDFSRDGILFIRDYIWLGSAFGIRKDRAQVDGFIRWARDLPDPSNTYQDWPLAYWVASDPDSRLWYIPKALFDYRIHGLNHSGGVTSSEKALRNWRRTLNTTAAMLRLANDRGVASDVRNAVERRLAYFSHVVALHDPTQKTSVVSFLRLAPWLVRQGLLMKEAIRFFGIKMLGLPRFANAQAALASGTRTNWRDK